ncbi:alpha-glucosidase 2 [Enterobacter cloacae]|uniref:Alpha-glucosidase 2 n=1 Tax=Enterobacter cloacae TaxID=550 RepID=A0A377M3D6_ENTCL|nr:alpha-glucosidase 2 [Enterobacter cloacae]
MYPGVTPAIRGAIELRYRLLPYLYTCSGRRMPMTNRCCAQPSSTTNTMRRPLKSATSSCWAGTCWWQAWWRPDSASAVSGCRITKPAGTIFTPTRGTRAGSGSLWMHRWEKLPLLVRAGAGLPLSERITHVSAEKDDTRELKLFPVKGVGTSTGLLFEDDGESWGYQNGNALWVEWEMVCDGATINLKITARGDYRPAWKALKVSLPAGGKTQAACEWD